MADDIWQNQWGCMKWADFISGKSIHSVSLAELPKVSVRSSKDFVEYLNEFKSKIQPGDELFHYDSHQSAWNEGMGGEGYVVVRDGELFDQLVIKMN